MAGNTDPIYSKVGRISGVEVTAANTVSSGAGTIGTDIFLAFTADSTNGSFVRDIKTFLTATTAATATTATVVRYFASSATSGATTASNTHPLGEFAVASQSADNSGTATFPAAAITLNLALPAGWTILVTNHAAPAANTKLKTVVFGGDY